jgi:hypothetical protein
LERALNAPIVLREQLGDFFGNDWFAEIKPLRFRTPMLFKQCVLL